MRRMPRKGATQLRAGRGARGAAPTGVVVAKRLLVRGHAAREEVELALAVHEKADEARCAEFGDGHIASQRRGMQERFEMAGA